MGYSGENFRNNPDLRVDPVEGWVFPELVDGGLGECVDNLLFYVEQ